MESTNAVNRTPAVSHATDWDQKAHCQPTHVPPAHQETSIVQEDRESRRARCRGGQRLHNGRVAEENGQQTPAYLTRTSRHCAGFEVCSRVFLALSFLLVGLPGRHAFPLQGGESIMHGRRLLEQGLYHVDGVLGVQGASIENSGMTSDQETTLRRVVAEQVGVGLDQVEAKSGALQSASVDVEVRIKELSREQADAASSSLSAKVSSGELSTALLAAGLDAQVSIKTALSVSEENSGGGVPTTLLVGVLVPVGVLLILLACAMYKYTRVFRQSRDPVKTEEDNKEGVRADGGVSAEVGFHDSNGGFHDTKGVAASDVTTRVVGSNGGDKFVAMEGPEAGVGLQKAKKAEAEKQRSAHPGIGLGSVFGAENDKPPDKHRPQHEIEEEGEGGAEEEEEPREQKQEEREREEEAAAAAAVVEVEGEEVKAEGGRLQVELTEAPRLHMEVGVGVGVGASVGVGGVKGGDDQSPGSASKAETEKEGEPASITALGTQPVQVWQDAPFAHPAPPPPPPALSAADPPPEPTLPAPQLPLPAPSGGSSAREYGGRFGSGGGSAGGAGSYAPRPLPAVPTSRSPLQPPAGWAGGRAGGEVGEQRLQELLRRPAEAQEAGSTVTGLAVPSEPDSPPPLRPHPTHSVAGLYSRQPGGRGAGGGGVPMLINGMGQQVGIGQPTGKRPSIASAPPHSFTPEASPVPFSSRQASREPAARFSPGPAAPPGAYVASAMGRGRQPALPSRDPRRRRIMNLHKEMFGGHEGEGITKPVELPGDKGVSYYQGRSSLAGRMVYSSIEFGAAPKAPFVPPGGMRDEDEMWG